MWPALAGLLGGAGGASGGLAALTGGGGGLLNVATSVAGEFTDDELKSMSPEERSAHFKQVSAGMAGKESMGLGGGGQSQQPDMSQFADAKGALSLLGSQQATSQAAVKPKAKRQMPPMYNSPYIKSLLGM